MPSGSAAWRTLVHRFELSRDLLQRPVWCCRFDACHQLNQSIVACLRSRTIQQCRLDHSFRYEPAYGSAKPLNSPRRAIAAIQDSDDIAPWLVWPHPTDCWQPGFELFEDTIEVGGGTAGPDLPDRVRVTGAQPGIAANPATRPGGVQPGLGALGDERPFELRDGPENLQGEHALRRGGIYRIVQTAEMRTTGFELFDDSEQVANRPGEPVKADDNQRFARTDLP